MTNTNQNWEEELNKWLETQDHKHNCIGYSEGTGCCLDVDDDDDSLYAGTARPFLKALVKKVEQQAKEQGRREGIEECVDELSSKLEIERQKGPQGIVRDTMNARTSQIIRLLQSKLTQH